jgi:hypothetical protein
MFKSMFDWLWSKRWFLFSFPILAGIMSFSILIGIELPDGLFFPIMILSAPFGLMSVILGWIHNYRIYKTGKSDRE